MRFVVAFFILVSSASAEELRGKVVAISDGDTITVLDATKTQHKVRLDGIDAPESKQAFGTRSRQTLGEMIHEKDVVVEWKKRDRYGRIIGKVRLGDRWINMAMIEAGMAWHYKQYSKDASLAKAENDARAAKRGLWADKSPVAPWEWRKHESERRKSTKAAKGSK